jgi:hypothetical protein
MRFDILPKWNREASTENEMAGETNTVPALDMTNTKSLIYRKVVTVKEVTSRPSMSCRGKKRPRTAAPSYCVTSH